MPGEFLNILMSCNGGSVPVQSSRGSPCFFVQPAFVGAICGAEGGWALARRSNVVCFRVDIFSVSGVFISFSFFDHLIDKFKTTTRILALAKQQ